MRKKIESYLRAGYPGLYVVSKEEQRVQAEIAAAAKDLSGYRLGVWRLSTGLVWSDDGTALADSDDPEKMLRSFVDVKMVESSDGSSEPNGTTIPNQTVVVLLDFHMIVRAKDPMITRLLKDALCLGKQTKRHLIVVGCQLELPKELESELTVIEFDLPGDQELAEVAKGIADSVGLKLNGNTEGVINSLKGLTTTEAENACALAVVRTGGLDLAVLTEQKVQTIKKNGILEIVEQHVTLDDIGGLENLKRDLWEKRLLFTKEAAKYGIPTPRPILTVGQPGTGKSLTATACGSVFGVPLLRLEAGRLFGSLVGQSEENWRSAFGIARSVRPCVLWIDEVDGLFSGAQSSCQSDGGTTSRVIKAILQDLQFNSDGIFFVFTCNDIDNLPDPLVDRCDVWSVDLPSQSEREQILRIHIAKRKRDPANYSVKTIAQLLDGFSGRQIEQVWIKAMTVAFNDGGREPTNDDFTEAASKFTPTSVTMRDAIERRRKRLEGRAQNASAMPAREQVAGKRKLSV